MKSYFNWGAVLLAGLLASCHATVFTPSPADALREQVQELEAKNSALQLQVEELNAQISRRSDDAAIQGERATITPELEQATPRVCKMTIGNLSRVVLRAPLPGAAVDVGELVVFLNVFDAKERALQLTGSLDLDASAQWPGGKVATLLSSHWGPLQLRELYRSGFGTPHYSLRLPILEAADMSEATILVVVTYVDGWTGRTLKIERAMPWPKDDFLLENIGKPEKAE